MADGYQIPVDKYEMFVEKRFNAHASTRNRGVNIRPLFLSSAYPLAEINRYKVIQPQMRNNTKRQIK